MIAWVALLAWTLTIDEDHTGGFAFDPSRVAVGKAYLFEKSNIDGTRASRVVVRSTSSEGIESFKYSPSYPEATLVKATMDWSTFSVRRFETVKIQGDGSLTTVSKLEARPDGRTIDIEAGPTRMSAFMDVLPWHSYDFDFTSLILTLPHLEDPEGVVTVGIGDVIRSPSGQRFGFKGRVDVEFVDVEMRRGASCLKYKVDGEGLENRGGHIWIDEELGHLVLYEIDLPDEPGFKDGKMKLLSTVEMTDEEWTAFKKARKWTAPLIADDA